MEASAGVSAAAFEHAVSGSGGEADGRGVVENAGRPPVGFPKTTDGAVFGIFELHTQR